MADARNLVNLHQVGKAYGTREVLAGVSLGIGAGDRIGVVGRNGDGKSTLLSLIGGTQPADAGSIVRSGGVTVGLLRQDDELDGAGTVRDALVGDRADHEWAGRAAFRTVLDGLLGGVGLGRLERGLDTDLAGLSGGERRRIALARILLDEPELLLLDEPTNHLDIQVVDWLAGHLSHRRGALMVVTHDRWFLDAVCTSTWEVGDRMVRRYEGGYAAYVLARAERERQDAAREDRRGQLLRKELAWLRRGPPARTTKPKFRVESANQLIAGEPEARDTVELMRFATTRLGTKVLELIDASVRFGSREVLHALTLRLGPGDRVALLGANGSGKTTLLKLLAGELEPSAGRLERGSTVRLAHLSQQAAELPGDLRVLESLERVRGRATLSDGRELTAGSLCERFGFRGDRARAFARDLSGGERRRLQLMRLLMAGPNVVLLDEPTNDLDLDTLTALEDLLDQWPGTLVVASHDRYFVERVCDQVYAIEGGVLRHLPGGVDQYLVDTAAIPVDSPGPSAGRQRRERSGVEPRAARKELRRVEVALARAERSEGEVHQQMAASASDAIALAELQTRLEDLAAERERLESEWLELSEALEA